MYVLALGSLLIDQAVAYLAFQGGWQKGEGGPFVDIHPLLQAAVAIVLIVALVRWRPHWSLGLVLGGTVSNWATELLYGQAIDYIPLYFVVTNLADILIVTGLGLYAIHLLRRERNMLS
ncbi:MAG TPA: signal peptidase II [Verrucomicrobiae bacterium]|nr:signal peptidase II [Verrucomicrobiae bacterium]